jgi:tRNA-modifying protein YgfZ
VDAATVREEIDALEAGRGILDLGGWGATEVRGADAERWLNDLVTASLEDLPPGETVRSLLLGPTGRIRADLQVARRDGGFLLLQAPGQPEPIAELLDPYVLSSNVELAPARPDGLDLTPRPGSRWVFSDDGRDGVRVGREAFEAWRVRHAIPAFPRDVDVDSVPSEAGLDEEPVVDRSKGCYLGQESVARIRNLGHPPRLVVPVESRGSVHMGDPVFSREAEVGIVTSVDPDGPAAMVRIRWDARDVELRTRNGIGLRRR